MPEYLEVETYHLCPDPRNTNLFDRFGLVLEHLGYTFETTAMMGKRLLALAQDPPREYYGDGLVRFLIPGFTIGGKSVCATPSILYYSDYENTHEPTMSLSLTFVTQEYERNFENISSFAPDWERQHAFLPGVGRLIWRVMNEFATIFPETPNYFVFEGQWGASWEALKSNKGNIWNFQVAIIPAHFAPAFSHIPDTFVRFNSADVLAFAERARWPILPWDE